MRCDAMSTQARLKGTSLSVRSLPSPLRSCAVVSRPSPVRRVLVLLAKQGHQPRQQMAFPSHGFDSQCCLHFNRHDAADAKIHATLSVARATTTKISENGSVCTDNNGHDGADSGDGKECSGGKQVHDSTDGQDGWTARTAKRSCCT